MKLSWQETAHIPETSLSSYQATLTPYTETLKAVFQSGAYEASESSINLPFDGALLQSVEEAKARLLTPELRFVVVIGIGGSSLGTRAIYDALLGFADVIDTTRAPRCIFLETFDPAFLSALTTTLKSVSSSREFAIVIVSKSGATTETIANAAALFQNIAPQFQDIFSRTAVITNADSPLARVGNKSGAVVLSIPQVVGGRYSVFSAVGLLPLALLGVDIEALRLGAGEVVSAALEGVDRSSEEGASILAYHHDAGRRIHDLFLFSPRLESLGKWYRQLLAESIGKERTLPEGVAHIGFTPTVSIGTTDFHSSLQLYLAGPRDKVTTFVYALENPAYDAVEHLHSAPPFLTISPHLSERTLSEIAGVALRDVKQAYEEQQLSYLSLELTDITAHELGAFMQYSMLQTMYLGNLLNVNAFDQPAVEAYKANARGLLRQ